MKKIFYLILFAFILQSCVMPKAVINKHKGAKPLNNKNVRVELQIDDIQYLGETEVTYEYTRTYFPLIIIPFDRLIAINGEKPDNGNKHYFFSKGLGGFFYYSNKMRRALYKAHVEFPEADYFDIKKTTNRYHPMFLGRKIKISATVKAYRYRYSQD